MILKFCSCLFLFLLLYTLRSATPYIPRKRCRISFHFVCLFAVFNNLWQSRCVWVLPHFVASLKFSECLVSQLSVPQLSVHLLPTAIRCKRSTYTYPPYIVSYMSCSSAAQLCELSHGACKDNKRVAHQIVGLMSAGLSVCLHVSLCVCLPVGLLCGCNNP